MRIGIITAFDQEARVFSQHAQRFLGAYDLVVKVAGPGSDQAARAAEELLDSGCDTLLSWGLAGGLTPTMIPAQLIVGSATIVATDEAIATDSVLQRRLITALVDLEPVCGPLYTSPHPITTAAEKTNLHAAHAAVAVDMESGTIARAAKDGYAKFAAIRCVVDPAGFDLPSAAQQALGTDGRLRVRAMLRHLLRYPGEVRHLPKLAVWYRAALDKLGQTARILVH